ncbi:hypothetical protein GVAV_001850 [Gurleya vavrai]
MTIHKEKRTKIGYEYRCSSKSCRSSKNIFFDKLISISNIPINKFLNALYKRVENVKELNVLNNLEISKKSYYKIKQNINHFLQNEIIDEDLIKLGGEGKVLQIEESVICQGFLNDCPSNLNDDEKGLTWVVGVIESDSKNMKIFIVPDRKIETLTFFFESFILPKTTIVTDGFASYP